MNIYPEESPLHPAFAHVALESDRVWWNEKDYGDLYKMANLNLYKTLIRTSNRPANSNENIDLLFGSLGNERTLGSSFETEQFFNWSFEACTRNQNKTNANTMIESIPAFSEMLKSRDASEKRSVPLLPYSIETLDDLILYNSLHQSAIKKLWSQEKPMQELEETSRLQSQDIICRIDNDSYNFGQHCSELNANVPEFYPSILHPSTQSLQKCPPVFDTDYQADLIQLKDDTKWSVQQSATEYTAQNRALDFEWKLSQLPRKDTKTVTPVTSSTTTQITSTSNVDSTSSSNNSKISNFPNYTVSLTNSYNLAASDFPELPKTQESTNDIITKTNLWLEKAFPKKGQDFKKIAEVAAHFDTLLRKLTNSQSDLMDVPGKQQDRRLYRDVLAQKEEAEEKEDGGLEFKYEELEREALAQYRASETSLVPTVVTELSPELEENLEREALEQYSGDFHLDIADAMATTAPIDSDNICAQSKDLDEGASSSERNTKFNCEEKCMMSVQNQQQKHQANRKQQQSTQSYQGKNRNRQRRGNKKKKGKWRSGGGGCGNSIGNQPGNVGSNVGQGTNSNQSAKASGTSLSETGHCNNNNTNNKNNDNILQYKSKLNYYNSIEIENKKLCTELKLKALTYLKGIDLNLTDEIKRNSNKNTIKQLLYKGSMPIPIVQSVKLEEIEDAETYKQYAKEVTNSARTFLLTMYTRIRTELVDNATAGNIRIVAPTTSEKRKVRHKILKCVQLLDRADQLKRVPRKPIESARREVEATLKLLHRTMEVVYALKDMSKLAFEDAQYLTKSKEILLDVYKGVIFIKDKSEYIQQKIFNENRNVLLVLLFPRREGFLLDRISERLETSGEDEQVGFVHTNYITANLDILTRGTNLELLNLSPYNEHLSLVNVLKFDHLKKKDLWAEKSWEHLLTIGNRHFTNVNLQLYGNINIFLLMNHINNLKGSCIKDRNYSLMPTNIISSCLSRDGGQQYGCCFCNNNISNSQINNENNNESCLLKEFYIRVRSPLRLFMRSIFENKQSPFWAEQNFQIVSPSTSNTQIIVQNDSNEDINNNNNNDNNDNMNIHHQQQQFQELLKVCNNKQSQRKTSRNSDSACCLQ